jgi:hypothetical protein
MVVLLIYGESTSPVSLVGHSHDGKTWFSLVNTPQQRAEPRLEATIRRALAAGGAASSARGLARSL